MKITLKRIALKETYTIGKLYIDDVYFCDTLEDKVRDYNKDGDLDDKLETKIFGQTAIPYGTYDVIISLSPRFKRFLPELLNVKHFDKIRIHAGNSPEDSHGCILVGENKEKGKVLNSRKYENLLVSTLRNNKNITIEII